MSKQRKYAIIDIETTGGMSNRDRITEIGIVIYDGEKVVKTYETLINPERSIPPNITRITGITNDMVSEAPKFFEVAKNIVEMTEDCIFVAHNVRFDYSFIRNEFMNLGYTYTKKQLCTVKLSRKVFPELKSYSLGNLIKHFNIKVSSRHRALEDARATTILFDKMIKSEAGQENIKKFVDGAIDLTKLPEGITKDFIKELPETAGVYYMYNEHGTPVYIGKSKNIKKRIIQHFGKVTKKNEKMLQVVRTISCEETGSELVALLLESREIKTYNPEINRAQRRKVYPYFLHHYLDLHGYITFAITKTSAKNKQNKQILRYCTSRRSASSYLRRTVKEFSLCDKLSALHPHDDHACIRVTTGDCFGACNKEELPQDYNERAVLGIQFLSKYFNENFILVVEGRTPTERAVVLVEDGNYQGYGYMEYDHLQYGVEEIKEAIHYVKDMSNECNMIIRHYLESTEAEIIPI